MEYVNCDALMSVPKAMLTHCVGALSPTKIQALNEALRVALEIPD
jgi:mRNA-degrading endonuclease toxin of MazEF toxin-antitoxin module